MAASPPCLRPHPPALAATRPLVLAAVASLLAVLLTAPAEARFTVSPATIDVRADAGRVSLGAIFVRTGGEGRQRFRVDIEDLRQDPAGGYLPARAGRTPFSAAPWIVVSPRSFVAPPEGRSAVEYAVRVPRSAGPGDHLAAVTVKRLPARKGQLATIQAVAVRITVHVRGKTREMVRIGAIQKPSLASSGPITIATTIRNTGNVRIDFTRRRPATLAVLAGSRTQASLPLVGSLYPGETRIARLRWEDPPLLAHPTVRVSVPMAGGAQTRSTRFWVAPWRQGVAVTLGALALIVVVRGVRRRRST